MVGAHSFTHSFSSLPYFITSFQINHIIKLQTQKLLPLSLELHQRKMLGSCLLPPKPTYITKFQSQSPSTLSVRVKSHFSLQTVKAAVSVDSVKLRKSSQPTTLYQVLCIKENASQTQVKAAYRSLAKLYHPDAAAASELDGQDFMDIHNAYTILSDPVARARYDLSISAKAIAAHQRHRYRRSTETSTLLKLRPTKRWETDQCW